MFDTSMAKVYIDMTRWPHRASLITACKQLDMRHQLGQAPAGYMEDRLSQLLQGLQV